MRPNLYSAQPSNPSLFQLFSETFNAINIKGMLFNNLPCYDAENKQLCKLWDKPHKHQICITLRQVSLNSNSNFESSPQISHSLSLRIHSLSLSLYKFILSSSSFPLSSSSIPIANRYQVDFTTKHMNNDEGNNYKSIFLF